jgi:DivIVA domain-containing protein
VIAVIVVALLGVAAMAAAGGMGEMPAEPVYDTFRQDLPTDRPLQAGDLRDLRFGVTLRGYSMRQVDEVVDRLARELAERDAALGDRDPTAEAGERTAAVPAGEQHR